LSGLFVRKLPEVPNYTVPAWTTDERTRAAPWYLEVYKGAERIDTFDLSSQSRFVCGRAGGEGQGVDLDLGTHNTISRCALTCNTWLCGVVPQTNLYVSNRSLQPPLRTPPLLQAPCRTAARVRREPLAVRPLLIAGHQAQRAAGRDEEVPSARARQLDPVRPFVEEIHRRPGHGGRPQQTLRRRLRRRHGAVSTVGDEVRAGVRQANEPLLGPPGRAAQCRRPSQFKEQPGPPRQSSWGRCDLSSRCPHGWRARRRMSTRAGAVHWRT